tara:strand:- start:9383 stop:9880 length:498 start_codon:yes stop_codon:yes gene_type:complete
MDVDINLKKLNTLYQDYIASINKLKLIRPVALSDTNNLNLKQLHQSAKNDYNKKKTDIDLFKEQIINKLLGNSNTFSESNNYVSSKNSILDILETTKNNLQQKSSGSRELYKNIELINTINIIDILLLFLIIFIFAVIYFRDKIKTITLNKINDSFIEQVKSTIN